MSTLPEDLVEPLPEADDVAFAPAPASAEGNEERHLRAVPPRRRVGPRRPALWIGSIVSAASLFLLVAFNVMMVQGQFTLDRIAQQRSIEQDRYEHLRAEVATDSSPDAIVTRAHALGLVDGQGPVYIQAPAAAPPLSSVDRTANTQQHSYRSTKPTLDASP